MPAQTTFLNDGISGLMKDSFDSEIMRDWLNLVTLMIDRTSLHVHFETQSRRNDGHNYKDLDHHCC